MRTSAGQRTGSCVVCDSFAAIRRERQVVPGPCGAGQAVREVVAARRSVSVRLLTTMNEPHLPVVALRIRVSERRCVRERQSVLARRVEPAYGVVVGRDVDSRLVLDLVDGVLLAVSAKNAKEKVSECGRAGARLHGGLTH